MFKSKAHFRVHHNGLITAVPASYITRYESWVYGAGKKDILALALSFVLNRKVTASEIESVDETIVIDEKGDKWTGERFVVHEYSTHFVLHDTETGNSHPIGDGVDSVTLDTEDGDNVILSPGTTGFVQVWEEQFNQNPDETIQAYFS